MNMFEQLAAPFDPALISWRAQSVKSTEGRAPVAMALAYIDARDVMRRLDDVCSPAGWQCRYPHATTKTICEIGIKHDGEWIWKANGAGDTDIEAEKGAISDAFKRSAVLWGIGRYLYDMPNVWAECELDSRGKWKAWTPAGLKKLEQAARQNAPAAPRKDADKPAPPADALITDDQRNWLAGRIDASGVPIADVCRQFEINSLKELTFGRAQEVNAWLKTQKKAA